MDVRHGEISELLPVPEGVDPEVHLFQCRLIRLLTAIANSFRCQVSLVAFALIYIFVGLEVGGVWACTTSAAESFT